MNRYISLMEKTLSAYSDAHIRAYFDRVKREGLTEHGFARLTSNLGVLITHGIRTDLLPLFTEMMDFCCKTIPTCKAANDFSVREIVTCLAAVERTGTVDRETTERWRADLRSIVPETCYTVYAKAPNDPVRNWALFTAVSEHLRCHEGLADAEDFVELQLASQMQWIDENGMYTDHSGTDVHQPIVYDLVPRALFSMLLHFGYRGKYYERIDALLRKSALLTLRMQSVTGEIPFGGRSNQFLHNEGLLAILFEFEASRYKREGDLALASTFKAAVDRALSALEGYLAETPIHHVKNRFPLETRYGCEKYGYFDKYMITAASWLYDAYLMSDDSIPVSPDPDRAPTVFRTSYHFHKVFLKCGGYALEFDLNADPHYDACGLGRVHKAGTRPEICLSVPCPKTPSYAVDRADPFPLALSPALLHGGVWQFATDAKTATYELLTLEERADSAYAQFLCRFSCGETLTAAYEVSDDGVSIRVCGNGTVAHLLPAFAFDGENEAQITASDYALTVACRGSICTYETDGPIVDLAQIGCNRNGHYRAFCAAKEGELRVTVRIRGN